MDGRYDLEHLLQRAASGAHEACAACPRNPRVETAAAFARCCPHHLAPGRARVMAIGLDPSGTGAGSATRTRHLCFECNQDQSAKNVQRWFPLLGIGPNEWYAANLVMHGLDGKNRAGGAAFEEAIRCCQGILVEQIRLVQPTLLIAFGKRVALALHRIEPIECPVDPRHDWPAIRDAESPFRWRGRWIAPLPHPGWQGTNQSGGPKEQEKRWSRLGRWLAQQQDAP